MLVVILYSNVLFGRYYFLVLWSEKIKEVVIYSESNYLDINLFYFLRMERCNKKGIIEFGYYRIFDIL